MSEVTQIAFGFFHYSNDHFGPACQNKIIFKLFHKIILYYRKYRRMKIVLPTTMAFCC